MTQGFCLFVFQFKKYLAPMWFFFFFGLFFKKSLYFLGDTQIPRVARYSVFREWSLVFSKG